MIVKDVEEGLSNFPEDVDIYFEYNGKQLHLKGISQLENLTGDPTLPSQAILMRFSDGS